MCIGPEPQRFSRSGLTELWEEVSRRTPALVSVIVLSVIVSCAGSGTSGTGPEGESPDASQRSEAEVPEEELDKLLEEEEKRRLKPSDKSPGPVMVSFFARRGSPSEGIMRQKSGNRFPNRAVKSGQQQEEERSEYQYMILLSKEWAYEDRPINEFFLDVAQPDVKIMRDWRMNRFIQFLNENRFSDFPAIESVSQEQVNNMEPGEKMITYWEGDQFRRVYFRDQMGQELKNVPAWSRSSGRDIQEAKNRLLIGYLRAFNAAGLSQMRVNVGPSPSRNRLDQLAEQASPGEQQNVQAELFRAKSLHENGEHRKARNVLRNVIGQTRGTTYRADAEALLKSINQALSNE